MKKPVVQLDLLGNYIKRFDSAVDAALSLNLKTAKINECCVGKNLRQRVKTCAGFIWLYESNYISLVENNLIGKEILDRTTTTKITDPVVQMDLNGNFVANYSSVSSAARALKIYSSNIWAVIYGKTQSCHGFLWKLANRDSIKLSFERNCPKCGFKIIYKSANGFNSSQNKNSLCRSCSYKIVHKSRDITGKNNPMFGNYFYDIWVKKEGKEKADFKMQLVKKKMSEKSFGKNNSNFGKPLAQGSGNGWKGWYKNKFFFRSLRELYCVTLFEQENIEWESAETKFIIPYIDHQGHSRTYRPDFLVENKYLIEVKPKKLIDKSPLVKIKALAAEDFCKKLGLKYKLIDPGIPPKNFVKSLRDSGLIKFMEKYEENFIKYWDNSEGINTVKV